MLTASWREFAAARPDLAAKGRALFYEYGVGLGFLATTRPDGGPRVHPMCPILTDDELFAMIVPGPKLRDLRRDGRYALHSETRPPPHQDDAFYLTGIATEVMDRATWNRVGDQMLAERSATEPWPGFADQVLFELGIDRCLLTLTQAEDGLPRGHSVWVAGEDAEPRP